MNLIIDIGNSVAKIAIFDKANTLVIEPTDVSVEGKNHKGKLPQGKRGAIVVEKVIGFVDFATKQEQ